MLIHRLVEPLSHEIPQMTQQNHDQVAASQPIDQLNSTMITRRVTHLKYVVNNHRYGGSFSSGSFASGLNCTCRSRPSSGIILSGKPRRMTYLTSVPPILIRIPSKFRMPIPTLPRPHDARRIPTSQPAHVPRCEPISPIRAMSEDQRFLEKG